MLRSIRDPEIGAVISQARTARKISVSVDGRAIRITTPFPSPSDWRDVMIYQALTDRFNHPDRAPRHAWNVPVNDFQGGSFNGLRAQLGYLQELGAGAIWLSPVQKNCLYRATYHGYGIQDFLAIDPRFASAPGRAEAELRRLIDEAHARGMYVIFDIVLNHTGDVFAYDGFGASAPFRHTPYDIRWRDEHGHPDQAAAPADPHRDAAIWPNELRRNDCFRRQGSGDEGGGDFGSFKELKTELREFNQQDGNHYPVRNALIRAYQYLIAKFDVDGYRIDTLKYVEREFALVFGNAMREFALSIGKKNFFTFGEVADNEEQIARYTGRFAAEETDLIGVDAALDFPLFNVLPGVAKGMKAPTELINMFAHRKAVQRGLLSSHGEASRFYVTFLDNHDQHERIRFADPAEPDKFNDQVTLALGCLFTLLGIPCVYYGTEQGLSGRGHEFEAVREALWGSPAAFNRRNHFYEAVKTLAKIRRQQPALRYGRQYFRPLSGDGVHFGLSDTRPGVIAFARILNDQEIVIAANTSTEREWSGELIVDFALNPEGVKYQLIWSNKTAAGQTSSVTGKTAGQVEIHEADGAISRGPARALRVRLQPMELQILGRVG
jgi:glycosidase